MKTLSGSLAALALIAAREGQWTDVARLISQAASAPDAENFLECELADNFQASCLVNSVSSASGLNESVAALSAALELNAEEEKHESLYEGDEIISLNSDEGVEDEEEDEDVPSQSSSSLIRMRFE